MQKEVKGVDCRVDHYLGTGESLLIYAISTSLRQMLPRDNPDISRTFH